jgi:hypothetical protein
MHGGLQLALTRLFEAPAARFSRLTSLTLRDFLEPHGAPAKRLTSRVRLCKVMRVTESFRIPKFGMGNLKKTAALVTALEILYQYR